MATVEPEAATLVEHRTLAAINAEGPNVFSEKHQNRQHGIRRRRRRSLAEVAGAAASSTQPVFDLYLLARLSVEEAADGESLDDQVRQGRRDAAAVLGVEEDRITFVQTDPDAIREAAGPLVRISATYISGAVPWEQRRDLREVIELAHAGRVQAITPNLDRVARNVEVARRFRRELVHAGIRTLFEGCVPYDLIDDSQQFIYGIRAEFRAFERRIVARRMFGGKIRAAREGFYIGGGLPFGTALEATDPGGRGQSRMVGDEAQMAVVVALFARRLQGIGVQELAARTREIGVAPNVHQPWKRARRLSRTQIYRILSSNFYVTGERRLKVTQPGFPVEVVQQRVALSRYVDPKVFDQVAAISKRRYGEQQPTARYLLGELVYHRSSDTPFTSSSTKTASGRYRYYTNPEGAAAQRRLRGQRGAVACFHRRRSRRIRAALRGEELEGMVLAQLGRAAAHRRVLRRMLELDRKQGAAERVAYVRNQKEPRQTQAAAGRLLEAFASGTLSTTEVTTRKYREIAGRVARLTVDAEKLKANLNRARGPVREAQVQEALRRLPDQLREATPSQRRALVGTVIARVWIDDDGRVPVRLRGSDLCRWPPTTEDEPRSPGRSPNVGGRNSVLEILR